MFQAIVTTSINTVEAGPAFDATDYSGCLVWLDGKDNSTILESISPDNPCEDGDNVRRWNDKSGNADHADQATAAHQAEYDSSIQGLKFVGNGAATSDYLRISKDFSSETTTTIFLVKNSTDSASIDFCWTAARYSQIADDGSSDAASSSLGGTNYVDGTLQSWSTKDDVHTALNSGSKVVWCISGGSLGGFVYLDLGWYEQDFGNYALTGDIHEFIIYDNVKSTADRDAITDALKAKWGIT